MLLIDFSNKTYVNIVQLELKYRQQVTTVSVYNSFHHDGV